MNILSYTAKIASLGVYCTRLLVVLKGVDKWRLRGLKPLPPQIFDKTNNAVWRDKKETGRSKFCWSFKFVEINQLFRVMRLHVTCAQNIIS